MEALTLCPVACQRPDCCSCEQKLPYQQTTPSALQPPPVLIFPPSICHPKHCSSSTPPRTVSPSNDTKTRQHTAGVTQQKPPSCSFKDFSKELFENIKIKGKIIKSFSQMLLPSGRGACTKQPPPEHSKGNPSAQLLPAPTRASPC